MSRSDIEARRRHQAAQLSLWKDEEGAAESFWRRTNRVPGVPLRTWRLANTETDQYIRAVTDFLNNLYYYRRKVR